jgi:glycosyltransferase involved in cell wall biosynthesis
MFASDNSVSALVTRVECALAQDGVNVALRLVHDFVERIVTEPICAAQVFASRELDQLCMRIGRQSLVGFSSALADPWAERKNVPTIVYLLSRLQRSGGHSRLVQDFIRAQPEKNHLILSTEVAGPSDKAYFEKIFGAERNVLFLRAPWGNYETRLNWLQSILLSTRPSHTYLFNHHQDSVVVSALVPEVGLRGSFCHHGDHHLCLGVYLSHLAHIDLHPMGFHYCRDQLGIDNKYLPLTFEDKLCERTKNDFDSGGPLTTATAARFNKVEIPYYVSYLEIIPSILKVTGGRHIHIGRLTPWALRRVYRQINKQGIPKERFIYIDWVPSVWGALAAHNVDIYSASFPYGAGLTLIEAMGAGIPLIMHQHMYSRVLSGLELAYPEAFRWSDPKDLLRYLEEILPEKLRHEKSLSRMHYEKYHRPKILQAYLKDPEAKQLSAPSLVKDFRPRNDEWAAWAESQLSLSRLLHRFAYRTFRRLRRLAS